MDVDESKTTASPISDIAPNGDVILVVGPDKVPLRVYSRCLCSASRVFNAMLGPNWSGGQKLSPQSPREIWLEEDDADALRAIFCVLHHRNADVPEILTPGEIASIAVQSDKYDLAVALKYVSNHWLNNEGKGLNLVEMGHLLTAALLFGNTRMFAAQTLQFMLYWDGTYLDLIDDEIVGQFLPFQVIYLLEQRRTQMRADLSDLILRHADPMVKCEYGKNCPWLQARNKTYEGLRSMKSSHGAVKMLNYKVADVVERIQAAISEDRLKSSVKCLYTVQHEPLKFEKSVAGQLEAIKKRATICIDCVRGINPCNFEHS